MLTLFSIPKPFFGDSAAVQRNALESWVRLRPRCEILLLGDDPGVAQAAAAAGVRHIPDVARNEHGTPLLDDAFAKAEAVATGSLLCYVNADIILLDDFLPAARRIPFRKFLMAGQRWDIDLSDGWDFDQPGWEERLRRAVRERGQPHPPAGSDYFVFPRGLFERMPPFAVGRPGWDNWFIHHARARGIPVVDASGAANVVHQNHGYGHVKQGTGILSEGPEGERNVLLAGGWDRIFILDDATHVLTPSGIARATADRYLKQRIDRLPCQSPLQRARHRLASLLFVCRGIPPEALWRNLAYLFSRRRRLEAAGAAGSFFRVP
jgi:hypothetical protein